MEKTSRVNHILCRFITAGDFYHGLKYIKSSSPLSKTARPTLIKIEIEPVSQSNSGYRTIAKRENEHVVIASGQVPIRTAIQSDNIATILPAVWSSDLSRIIGNNFEAPKRTLSFFAPMLTRPSWICRAADSTGGQPSGGSSAGGSAGKQSPPTTPPGGQKPPKTPSVVQKPLATPPGGPTPPAASPGGQTPPTRLPGGQAPPAASPGGQTPPARPPGGQPPPAAFPGGQTSPARPPGGQPPPAASPGGQTPPAKPPGGQPPPAASPGRQTPPSKPPGSQPPPAASPGGQTPPSKPPGGQLPPAASPGGQTPPATPPGGQTPPAAPPGGQPPSATPPGGQPPSAPGSAPPPTGSGPSSTGGSGPGLTNEPMIKAPIHVPGLPGAYAEALYSAAYKQNKLDIVEQDLIKIRDVYNADVTLRDFLLSPDVTIALKLEGIQGFKKLNIDGITMNLLITVIQRRRMTKLLKIIAGYLEIVAAHKGIVDCQIMSARPLNPDQKKRLQDTLAKFLPDKTSRLTETVDANIIGGFILLIGQHHINMSMQKIFVKYESLIRVAA